MKKEPIPAIKVVDEILRLATTISDKEIAEALSKIRQAEGTWGLLWGLDNIQRSGMDLDYYGLKRRALEFLQELRKDEKFGLVVIVAARAEE